VNQEKLLFSAPSPIVHFRESLHSIESLLSNTLFGRAGFSLEATLGALPNRPYMHKTSQHTMFENWYSKAYSMKSATQYLIGQFRETLDGPSSTSESTKRSVHIITIMKEIIQKSSK